MRDVAEHASWWDRELEKLWIQAGAVLGDHTAHVLVADVMRAARTGGDDAVLLASTPWFGAVSTLRGRPTTDLRRAPKVFLQDGRIAVEIPDGVGVLGDLHLISVHMRFAGIPAAFRVRIGLDADPTADDAGVNLYVRGELDIDLSDALKVLLGLWAIEHGVNWGPLTTAIEASIFTVIDLGIEELPSFGRLRYSRRELQPRRVAPTPIHGPYGAAPTGTDRIDWWDVVFVSDGYAATARADFDAIVADAVDRLTNPAAAVTDDGAPVWRAYSGALRVWTLPLTHAAPTLTVSDDSEGDQISALRNMAQIAEAGLVFEDHLRAEYPDAPPVLGRTTWVIVRPEDARATAFGNFVLLPATDVAGGVSVLIHELGHLGLAGLGDEYVDGDEGVYRGPEPSQPNLSTSRTPEKWARFPGLLRPSQGAYDRYPRRIYRPAVDCRMREAADETQGFCPVCEDAIATGLLAHLTEGSGRLQPPLELDVELTWPFRGRRRVLTGAGIGPGGRVPQLPMPYLEVDGDDLRVAATVTVLRAAVPAPHRPAVSSVIGPPRGLARVRVEGTHPNVGFPDGVEATQSADLRFAERLTPEDFGFGAPSTLRQVAAGRAVPVGGEVRADVDRDTGDFRTDVALSAVSAGRPHDDLRLRSWTLFTLTQSGLSAAAARRFTFVDPAEGPRVRHVAETPPLEVGHYRWRVESRLAAHEEAGSPEDRPGPWRLGSDELDLGGADFHFAVLAPEPVDAAPRVPVPLAAGRVQVTIVVHREGSGRLGDWSRSGFVEVGLAESVELIGRGHVPRLPIGPGLIISGWPPGAEPPDIGAIERFVDRLPPREVVRTRSVVMIARSWSRAFESLRMEFQVSHDGGAWADVPPSPLALRQRDTWMDPDAPGLSAKVVYWEYADVAGDAASRWRCRAIDRSGHTSRWSPPAPLLDFNTETIPARLGVLL